MPTLALMPDGQQPRPWERQDGETAAAFRAFCFYRDAGPRRSIDEAWRAAAGYREGIGRVPGRWREWSVTHRWQERVRAYDAHMELLAQREREAEYIGRVREHQERQRKLAAALTESAVNLLVKASARLKDLKPEEVQPGALPSFFRAAAAVAEASTNSEAEALAVEELLKALNDGTLGSAEAGSAAAGR